MPANSAKYPFQFQLVSLIEICAKSRSKPLHIIIITGYVALALSEDDQMGRDSVVECVNEQGAVKAYTSWTIKENGKFDSPRTGVVSVQTISLNLSFLYNLICPFFSPKTLSNYSRGRLRME